MYPSNINGNPISYTLHDFNNFTSKQDHQDSYPSSLFNYFPSSPYIHYDDENLALLQHLHGLLVPDATTNMEDSNGNHEKGDFPTKRSSKKDRHSKVNTAQGPRDRRMRLSLGVAREFFSLQDMLGFDKASKTINWLLTKSKPAIEEVIRGANSASSTSECEVVSGIEESFGVRREKVSKSSAKEKKNKALSMRKSAFDPLARESRDKARERARERTKEKKRIDEAKLPNFEANMNRFGGSWSDAFQNGEESGTNINPQLDHVLNDVEELSSSMIFNNNNNSGVPQENQFVDFGVYGKSWEAYNNINLC